MSNLSILIPDLQTLASETRRRHADIREAADRAIQLLRSTPEPTGLRNANTPDALSSSDEAFLMDVLRPALMGCATKNSKVVPLSLGILHKVILQRAIPRAMVPQLLSTMNSCVAQGVDVQLRILQILLSLLTSFREIHGPLLADALLLCFRLQDSRIAVVSSTAAATLRQLVMFVFDKVVDEEREEGSAPMQSIVLPDGSASSLRPAAYDAYSILQDLCFLANSENPRFLQLDVLPKTFALELIESILSNYYHLLPNRAEILQLIHHYIGPLLLKTLSDRAIFPLSLRAIRVVFILLKQFSKYLPAETEVFMTILIKIVSEDGTSADGGRRPPWMRVLSAEVLRGICSDADLLCAFWVNYDSQSRNSIVFASLVSALNRLITEKPVLLGMDSSMQGVGVQGDVAAGNALDAVAGVAGYVASAATSTVSGALGIQATESGLSMAKSAMKLQCIDQLDKADAPPIPETYIYLLGVQCLVSLAEGLANLVHPSSSVILQEGGGSGMQLRPVPAIDIEKLSQDSASPQVVLIVHSMINNAWPALLASLSFLIGTNLSEEIFADVLGSLTSLANASGILGLRIPRDAFLTSLSKFAIPARVVSKLEAWVDQPTPRSASVTDGFSTIAGAGPTLPPHLSEKNAACLKSLVMSCLLLAECLGSSWYSMLEALQNADYVLTSKGMRSFPTRRATATSPISQVGNTESSLVSSMRDLSRPAIMREIDTESILATIQDVFDASVTFTNDALYAIVTELCKLSKEMIGMEAPASSESNIGSPSMPTPESPHRRRVSGLQLSRAPRSGDFGIRKLGHLSVLNIRRMTESDSSIWDSVTSHLSAVLRHPMVPAPTRLQAAEVLDEILILLPRNISKLPRDTQPDLQLRWVEALATQVIMEGQGMTVIDLRRMGLETLLKILQISSHELLAGWERILDMLGSVCGPASVLESPLSIVTGKFLSTIPEGGMSKPRLPSVFQDRPSGNLVRVAFQSLSLVCDALSSFTPTQLQHCIRTLGIFGRQTDTNIALSAAESLLWVVSDAIQLKRKEPEKDDLYSEIWMYLLVELQGLCVDTRPEVRGGSIQTLFRTLELYGSTLKLETWEACIWRIVFPLLDAVSSSIHTSRTDVPESVPAWENSKVLVFNSLGTLLNSFLVTKILDLQPPERFWGGLLSRVGASQVEQGSQVATSALRCLEKSLGALVGAGDRAETILMAAELVWTAWSEMGQNISADPQTTGQFYDQETLLALVDVVQALRKLVTSLTGDEWELSRLEALVQILEAIMTYRGSSEYRPDTDGMTSVQEHIVKVLDGIKLSVIGAPSLVLTTFSTFIKLAFDHAFDTSLPPGASPNNRRKTREVTYVGVCKASMPKVATLFQEYSVQADIYDDGTVARILEAYAVPMSLRYGCPSPVRFGNRSELPLFKVATTCAIKVLREISKTTSLDISEESVYAIWEAVQKLFSGAFLANCAPMLKFGLDEQRGEETFDFSLVHSLEVDVLPRVGHSRIPDRIITKFGQLLQRASRLAQSTLLNDTVLSGTTLETGSAPRERFSFWCFDLLFLTSSNSFASSLKERERVAFLFMPSLLARCQNAMSSFIQDAGLRSGLPFSRYRENEIIYILQKLRVLTPLSPEAHLTACYAALVDIASSPSRGPVAWVRPIESIHSPSLGSPDEGAYVEIDARSLARSCLKRISREGSSILAV